MRKTFRELTQNVDMILINKIVEIDYELELESWRDFHLYSEIYTKDEFENLKVNDEIEADTDFNDECEISKDIYQYFAISKLNGEYLSKITQMPLYYSNLCDIYILWVDFLDNWENASYEIKDYF